MAGHGRSAPDARPETGRSARTAGLYSAGLADAYGMDAPTLNGIDVPKWKCWLPLKRMGASTMKITTVGIDLAKNVFQVHGIDERGKTVLRKQLRRAQVAVFFGILPPCLPMGKTDLLC